MPAGRPTSLTPELIKQAQEYINNCRDEISYTNKGAVAYVKVDLPSRVSLARYLKINKDTITEWCKGTSDIEQEFSVIVKEIEGEQEKRLLNNGLGGLYAPKIVGMILSKHGYSERTETDITSKGEKIETGSDVVKELANKLNEVYREQK